ncbi:MAG: hypothetical protein ACE5K4_07855 [Candidatus Hydrothermarchaeota archaeon]
MEVNKHIVILLVIIFVGMILNRSAGVTESDNLKALKGDLVELGVIPKPYDPNLTYLTTPELNISHRSESKEGG